MIALKASRPNCPADPARAADEIRTPMSTGAITERMRRRKIVLTIARVRAQPGASQPKAAPSTIATTIQPASDRRFSSVIKGSGPRETAASVSA